MLIKSNDINCDDVLSAASRLQGLITNAVLVGETASAIFATHRTSYDANHIVQNLREKFDLILETLESVAGWETARIKRPMLILGNLDGIETGVRQLIRTTPLETQNVYTHGQKITVPTEAEILRIKGALILKSNATRDYFDFAALSHHIGLKATLDALMRFDDLYPQKNGQSALQQLYLQLANPHPFDLDGIDLSTYKHLSSDWQSWENVAQQCQRIACGIFAAMKKTGEPDDACSPAPGRKPHAARCRAAKGTACAQRTRGKPALLRRRDDLPQRHATAGTAPRKPSGADMMPSPSWSWPALFAAGLLEAAWAFAMKLSQGFTRPLPSVLTLLFMAGSVVLLAFAMKRLPLGTAYAVWTGLGAVGAALAGIAFFGEAASPLRVGSLALIVLGIAGLKLAG